MRKIGCIVHRSREEAIEHFWSRVEKTADGCWNWTGSKNIDGYGRVGIDGKTFSTHRLSYSLFNGDIPSGKSVLHHCDNPPCVNPEHLFIGTQADNVRDCASKGRIRVGNRKGERHPTAKLTEDQVNQIRFYSGYLTQEWLANYFGVARQTVGDIITRRIWKHI